MARLSMENLARKDDPILVLNSGSSSLKFGVYHRGSGGDGDEKPLLTGSAEGIGQNNGTFKIRFSDGILPSSGRASSNRKMLPFPLSQPQSGSSFISLQSPSAIAWNMEGPNSAPTSSLHPRFWTSFAPPLISRRCTSRKL